ncbi:hypothetical protein PILCRDRAFT_748012 [Piloderma croceum F 1598]|uniref:Uncharacterized protein n=1 Tax=Piloderma croceum (strain F 1598) TaxID=765440 RepID=A0A0C3EV57_PILCF|nr:hypothetical protein PILCRDRAFT_748012 [Piloderma croceum F 1598]
MLHGDTCSQFTEQTQFRVTSRTCTCEASVVTCHCPFLRAKGHVVMPHTQVKTLMPNDTRNFLRYLMFSKMFATVLLACVCLGALAVPVEQGTKRGCILLEKDACVRRFVAEE